VGVKAYHPEAQEVELSDGSRIPAAIVLFSVGVRPELELARKCGAWGVGVEGWFECPKWGWSHSGTAVVGFFLGHSA
jgi:NADPH-dependent 2,4-dienoyl-CoA reductase/sulfur reductase-like enzyme